MFKRILALMLCGFMVLGMCACNGKDPSESSGETTDGSSADVNTSGTDDSQNENSSDNASADNSDASSDDSSADDSSATGDSSKDDSSEEDPMLAQVVDKEGYLQYKAVAAVDDTVAERGFKDKGANSDYVPLNYDKMKAVWISQFDFNAVYCNSIKQRSEKSFKTLVEQAYDNLVAMGFNTVIVQVRPNGDSFYPSAYYPWSSYVVGSYGKYGKYDPLQIMIDLAHEKGLSFQAWINPMRAMSSANLEKVNDAYPLKSWTKVVNKSRCAHYLYNYSSLMYLNIAYEEVRQLIIDAAAEIVRYYDVDGVHMDDYFYWGEEPNFDAVAFGQAKRKDATLNLQKFRYNNLNTLVSGIYSAIKAENKNVIFGISPAGNIDQMANKYYADINTWLSKDGYVDYIMPQLYFGMEHTNYGYADIYQRWVNVIKNPDIKFMAGMSLGKAKAATESGAVDQYAGAGQREWIDNKDVFKKCLQFATSQSKFDGYAIFCYQYLFDPIKGTPCQSTLQEVNNCKSYLTTKIKGEVIKYQ